MTEKKNYKYKWIFYIIYAAISALFMASDYTYNQNLQVKINLVLVFLVVAFFVTSFRLILEVFIVRFSAWCFKAQNVDGRRVLSDYLYLSIVPASANLVGFLVQILFLQGENALYQTIWLTVTQSVFYALLYRRIVKQTVPMGLKLVLIAYYVVYVLIQTFSLI